MEMHRLLNCNCAACQRREKNNRYQPLTPEQEDLLRIILIRFSKDYINTVDYFPYRNMWE